MIGVVPFENIDDLSLLRELGRGGLGTVYLAAEKGLERQVAIKLLQPEIVADSESRERFLREALVLSQLQHVNIINFFRYGVWNDTQPYLVMQYFPSTTLTDIMREPLDTRSLVNIFTQVCLALEFAHAANIIHRDIKPSNILVDNFSLVKLIDFGLCRMTSAGGQDQKLTRAGTLVGTPMYVSPEQCRALELDARSDIYSLGCVLYHCAFGVPPYTGESVFELMIARTGGEPKYNAAKGFDPSPELVALIKKSLQRSPDNRFQNVSQMREALLAIPFEIERQTAAASSKGMDPFARVILGSCLAVVAVSIAFVSAALHCAGSINSAQIHAIELPAKAATAAQFYSDLDRVDQLIGSGRATEGLALTKSVIKNLNKLEYGYDRTCLTYRVHNLKAECFNALGHYDAAEKELVQTIPFARTAKAYVWMANSFARLGYYYQKDKDLSNAHIYFNSAHEQLQKLPITKEVADSFIVLASYPSDASLSRQYCVELLDKYTKFMKPDAVAFLVGKVVGFETPHDLENTQTVVPNTQDEQLRQLQILVSRALTCENNGRAIESRELFQQAAAVCEKGKRYERVRRFVNSKLNAGSK